MPGVPLFATLINKRGRSIKAGSEAVLKSCVGAVESLVSREADG